MKRMEDTIIQTFLVMIVLHLSKFIPGLFPYSQVLIPAGIYVLLYRFLHFGYRKWVWPIIHQKESLVGTWVYTLKSKNAPTQVYGMFHIQHAVDDIKVNGECWYFGQTPERGNMRGAWYSEVAHYENNELWLIYKMHIKNPPPGGVTEHPETYTGALQLLIGSNSNPTKTLHGRFAGVGERFQEYGPVTAVSAKKIKKIVDRKELPQLVKDLFGEDVSEFNNPEE